VSVTAKLTYPYEDLYVTVDDEDAYLLQGCKWGAQPNRNTYYATRNVHANGKQKMILLHRVIMQAPDDIKVDHIDGNGLNCGRSNMRLATNAQNCRNHSRKRGVTGYIGVVEQNGMYQARINVDYQRIHLGYYTTPEDAARARDKAAIEHHGSFAVLNFKNPS
jgi:hypothetical protein